MGNLKEIAKRLGRNHKLAAALWDTGWYEARMLASFVDGPERVTAAQMDRWCRELDNWAICDTAGFHLFDRTPLGWQKAHWWSILSREFVKRAAFALMASLAGHDKSASDEQFLALPPIIEKEAHDERNFVKKAGNWALRRIGERRGITSGVLRRDGDRRFRGIRIDADRWRISRILSFSRSR